MCERKDDDFILVATIDNGKRKIPDEQSPGISPVLRTSQGVDKSTQHRFLN